MATKSIILFQHILRAILDKMNVPGKGNELLLSDRSVRRFPLGGEKKDQMIVAAALRRSKPSARKIWPTFRLTVQIFLASEMHSVEGWVPLALSPS